MACDLPENSRCYDRTLYFYAGVLCYVDCQQALTVMVSFVVLYAVMKQLNQYTRYLTQQSCEQVRFI